MVMNALNNYFVIEALKKYEDKTVKEILSELNEQSTKSDQLRKNFESLKLKSSDVKIGDKFVIPFRKNDGTYIIEEFTVTDRTIKAEDRSWSEIGQPNKVKLNNIITVDLDQLLFADFLTKNEDYDYALSIVQRQTFSINIFEFIAYIEEMKGCTFIPDNLEEDDYKYFMKSFKDFIDKWILNNYSEGIYTFFLTIRNIISRHNIKNNKNIYKWHIEYLRGLTIHDVIKYTSNKK